MHDADAGGAQFVGADSTGAKHADVDVKLGAVEAERGFGHLPLAASMVEFANHEQYPRFHLRSSGAVRCFFQDSNPQWPAAFNARRISARKAANGFSASTHIASMRPRFAS